MANVCRCDRCGIVYGEEAGIATWEDKDSGEYTSLDLCESCLDATKAFLAVQKGGATDGD